tara:strand:- start:485 stop:928 length:444 start_codon:yes stop_codon:yes gene_type:complete
MNWKQKILGIGVGLLLTTTAQAGDLNVVGVHVHDHYKDILKRQPHQVEVCYDKRTNGSAGEGALLGMILGGTAGKALGGDDKGAAVGAIIGGIIGADKSQNNNGSVRTVCKVETRFTETKQRIYSHSTIVFRHNGTEYRLRFDKRYP